MVPGRWDLYACIFTLPWQPSAGLAQTGFGGWGSESGKLHSNLRSQTVWVYRVQEYFANGKTFGLLGNFLERTFVII